MQKVVKLLVMSKVIKKKCTRPARVHFLKVVECRTAGLSRPSLRWGTLSMLRIERGIFEVVVFCVRDSRGKPASEVLRVRTWNG